MNRVGIIKRSGFANLGFGTGAMRVLLECLKHHNVEVIKLMGCSAGSFLLPLEAIGLFEESLEAWLNLTPDKIAKLRKLSLIRHPFKRPSILDSGPLREYANKLLEPNLDLIFSNTAIPFEIITTDLKTGDGVYFGNTRENKNILLDICMASAALVPLLPPVQINGLSLVDGAFSDDMPIKRLVDSGCDLIFVVDVYSGIPEFSVPFKELAWPDLILRTSQISIDQHSRLRLDANQRINQEIGFFNNVRGIDAAAQILNSFNEYLKIEQYSECKIVFVRGETPIERIGFHEFQTIDQTNLVEIGYWAAKTALKKLNLDFDGV